MLGAQLYTVREFTTSISDISKTLKKVADIGYEGIQISAFGSVNPKEVAELVTTNGLKVASIHENWKRFLSDLDEVVAEHKIYGCTHAAIGGLPAEYFSLKGFRPVLERAPIRNRKTSKRRYRFFIS